MIIESYPEAARLANLNLLIGEGGRMIRNDDLIRELMLEIEERLDPIFPFPPTLDMDAERREKYYHLRLLVDEGLLEESGQRGGIFRMTNKGHDFTQAVRDDTIWNRTKAAASGVAGVSLSMLKDIALGYVRQELVKLGVPLG